MTDEEARSLRQRAFDLIGSARRRVNPKTTEHIAEVAMRNAGAEIEEYVRAFGWRQLVRNFEEAERAQFRQTRSGHQNASGRYRQLRDILEMPVVVEEQHLVLGELDLASISILIQTYERKAEEMLAEKERLSRIAAAMKEEGAETVADLGSERVELLYTGDAQNV